MASRCQLSVILPVYNGESFLLEAVASVMRSASVIEIILVDDGSSDGTPDLARTWDERVIYIRQKHRGPAAARNRGLEVARGEFIAFIDADDEWAPAHPEAALRELEKSDLAFGQTQCVMDSFGESEAFGPPFHTFHLGSAVCRRALFERTGGFDEALRFGEDLDWFLRRRDCGASIVQVRELSLYYRLHVEIATGFTGRRAPGCWAPCMNPCSAEGGLAHE